MDDATPRVRSTRSVARAAPKRRLATLALGTSWPSFAALAAIFGVLVYLSFHSGGYFPTSYLPAGAAVFTVLAVLLVAHTPRWTFPTSGLVALGCLAGYAAWAGLSTTWSPDPAAALEALELDAVYVGLLALGLIAAGSGRHARLLPWVALAILCIVCGAGLLSRLLPDLIGYEVQIGAISRLSYPLSYWNTYGAMAAMGVVLALGLASDAGGTVFTRALAAAVTVPLGAALWFSLSRASWLALIVGVVALLMIGHRRGSLLVTMAVVGGAVGLVILRARSYEALTENPGSPGTEADGRALLVQIIMMAGFVAAAVAVIAAARRSSDLMRAGRTVFRPIGIGLAVLAVVGAVAVYGAKTTQVEGQTAKRGVSISTWVSKQWDEFLAPTTLVDAGTARLSTAKGTRSDMYRVAIDGFQAHPLKGDGVGGFEVRWFETRDVDETIINAHSLELETLSEMGLIGALLLLGFLVAVGTAAVRSRARPGGMGRSQAASVSAALVVWLVHSSVDWDWQMPALTGVAILLAASLFPEGRKRIRRTRSTA